MLYDWTLLSDELQLTLSHEALRRAATTLAEQADTLAEAMAHGELADRGGPDALRLFAAVLRMRGTELEPVAGHG